MFDLIAVLSVHFSFAIISLRKREREGGGGGGWLLYFNCIIVLLYFIRIKEPSKKPARGDRKLTKVLPTALQLSRFACTGIKVCLITSLLV